MKRTARHWLLPVLLASLTACSTTPLPELPGKDVPDAWLNVEGTADTWPDADWWRHFESEELEQVLAGVETRNLDLASNRRNLRLAQLALRNAGYELWPTPFVQLDAASQYAGTKPPDGDFTDGAADSVALRAGLVYTDILSKPAIHDGAKAQYEASLALIADVRLDTLATAASTYFRVLLLRDRIAAAEQNLGNARKIARIVDARVRAGTVNRIDLLQQEIAVQRQENELRSLRQEEFAARAALALLVADSVQDFDVAERSLADVAVPSVLPGLPRGLLTRRPDILQAEANLKLSRANVDLVRIAYLPDVSLVGTVSLASDAFDDIAGNAATNVSATASLIQLLLDNGARRRNLEAARLELESALADYRETVIAAFNEIEVALGDVELLEALGRVAQEDLARAEEAFRIAEVRYREGVADFQEVLVTQNSLFDARNAVYDNKLARINAAIALYRALGGGAAEAVKAEAAVSGALDVQYHGH